MRVTTVSVLTLIGILAIGVGAGAQNLGYNSYEGYYSRGSGMPSYFGPGVGYPGPQSNGYPATGDGDAFRKYIPADKWGQFGYGTGHLGQGWGPYIYGPREGASAPGMFDPLEQPYTPAPPPIIKVKHGRVIVGMPGDIPGIKCVTVTMLAFNGAELASQSVTRPPYHFDFPVLDGVKNVRVRIDYCDSGLSATSYPI